MWRTTRSFRRCSSLRSMTWLRPLITSSHDTLIYIYAMRWTRQLKVSWNVCSVVLSRSLKIASELVKRRNKIKLQATISVTRHRWKERSCQTRVGRALDLLQAKPLQRVHYTHSINAVAIDCGLEWLWAIYLGIKPCFSVVYHQLTMPRLR